MKKIAKLCPLDDNIVLKITFIYILIQELGRTIINLIPIIKVWRTSHTERKVEWAALNEFSKSMLRTGAGILFLILTLQKSGDRGLCEETQ